MRFPLLVPGGRFAMVTAGPVSLAKRCNLRFHRCMRAVAAASVGTCGTSHTLMPHEGKVGGTKRLTRHWALCGAALVVC